jgi:hypothetical protein
MAISPSYGNSSLSPPPVTTPARNSFADQVSNAYGDKGIYKPTNSSYNPDTASLVNNPAELFTQGNMERYGINMENWTENEKAEFLKLVKQMGDGTLLSFDDQSKLIAAAQKFSQEGDQSVAGANAGDPEVRQGNYQGAVTEILEDQGAPSDSQIAGALRQIDVRGLSDEQLGNVKSAIYKAAEDGQVTQQEVNDIQRMVNGYNSENTSQWRGVCGGGGNS